MGNYREIAKKHQLNLKKLEDDKKNIYLQLNNIKYNCEQLEQKIRYLKEQNEIIEKDIKDNEKEIKDAKKDLYNLLIKIMIICFFIGGLLSSMINGVILIKLIETILFSLVTLVGIFMVGAQLVIPKIYKKANNTNIELIFKNDEKIKETTEKLNDLLISYKKIEEQYKQANNKYQSQKDILELIVDDLKKIVSFIEEDNNLQEKEEYQKSFQKKYGSLI